MLQKRILDELERDLGIVQRNALSAIPSTKIEEFLAAELGHFVDLSVNSIETASLFSTISRMARPRSVPGTDEDRDGKRYRTLLAAFEYLSYYEGPMQMLCAAICMLGTRANHYFVVRRGERDFQISKSEDILDTRLDEKLGFLSVLDIMLPEEAIDQELRNVIAHMTFKIDNDGNLVYHVLERRGPRMVPKRKVSIPYTALVAKTKDISELCLAMLNAVSVFYRDARKALKY